MSSPESRRFGKRISEVKPIQKAVEYISSLFARTGNTPDENTPVGTNPDGAPYIKFADRTNYTIISNERFETLLTADFLQEKGKLKEAEWLRSLVDNSSLSEREFYDLNIAYSHGDENEIKKKKAENGFTDEAELSSADNALDILGDLDEEEIGPDLTSDSL